MNIDAGQATISHIMIIRLTILGCICASLTVFTPALALAQEAESSSVAHDRSFNIQLFETAPGQDALFTVDSARTTGHLSVTAGLVIGYQHHPFSIVPCAEGTGGAGSECELDRDNEINVVSAHLHADVLVSLSLWYMLQIAVGIPVNLYQSGDSFQTLQGGEWVDNDLGGSTGLGDVRLHLKWTAPFGLGARQDSGFGLAIAPVITFPTGNATVEDAYMGDGQVTVHPQLLLEYRVAGLQIAGRVGYRWREESVFMSSEMGQQLTYGVGASYAFPIGRYGHEIRPVVEIFGTNGFTKEVDQNPLELDLGLHIRLSHDFLLMVGAGFGLVSGIGAPEVRAFAGFFYSPRRFDRDRDNIMDRDDDCPNDAEDADGFEDTDGCPEADNDGDNIPDGVDRCPDDPEDADQVEDDDGCPEPDNDGDGVNDGYDTCADEIEDFDGYEDDDGCPDLDHDHDNIPTPRDHCPYEAEDTDGFADEDGCPDADYDGDGIDDDEDPCPEDAEDFDGNEDHDGCPDLDNDNDGVADAQDQCPDRPETWNANADHDGCPEGGRSFVTFRPDRLETAYPIEFSEGTAEVTGQRSTGILDIITAILTARARERIRIVSYASDPALAQRRGEAVVAYLVDHGIAAERLEVRPVSPGSSPIEFQVIPEVIDDYEAPPPDAAPEETPTPTEDGGGEMAF